MSNLISEIGRSVIRQVEWIQSLIRREQERCSVGQVERIGSVLVEWNEIVLCRTRKIRSVFDRTSEL